MIYLQNLTNEFCELRKQYIDAKFMTMNPMQKKAIYNVDGPVLVLAGAGSGKTTTIIGRIVYMVMFGHAYYSTETTFPVTEGDIKELKSVLSGTGSISEHLKSMLQVKPVSPQNIMAVTFTNKAAGEMKKRLESKLGKDTAEKVCAKTFHSACVGILREYAMFVGFKRDFTIYDEKDCKSVLKDIYKANGIKEKELHKDDVLNHISIWKDKMITPDMAISQSTISSYNTVAHLYKEYQERLKNANAMDFDDLIGNTIRLLKEHPDIQAELQKKIQYIMVDEYQDTNASQHELLSLLVSPEHNICVVGDDDQSIYSFRGADVDNILNFPQEFNGTHIIKMEQNYRSDGNILNLANSLIGHNTKRHNKNLWTYRNPGVMPTYTYYASDYDETDSIVEDIKDYIAAGNNYSDVAILYRNSRLSYVIERALAREKIPYKIVGGFKFFERAEVKDIIAYLCVIANPADDQRLKRIINVPARKIGAATVDKIATLAQQYKVSMMEIIRNADLYPAIAKAKPALDSFIKMYDTMCLMANGSTLGELTQSVIKYSGYRKMLEDKGVDGKDELQNVEQVVVAAEEFEHAHIKTNLSEFLAEISLLSAVDTLSSEENKVVMMTLHASKGLEFKNVYIIGLEDSIIPSSRDDVGIEEERRLLYVGMTRAKEELHLSTAKQRHTFGAWGEEDKPSRFLYDIDQQDIDYGTSRNNIFARKNAISWDMNALF
jgi:DNA helicase-2/ATP-dependent DNA helicase PcrA